MPITETTERRVSKDLELRVVTEEGQTKIVGYASIFNRMSLDLGGFREIVLPGAFRQSLEDGADVRALVDHDSSKIIGRNKAGTLRVREDDMGLRVTITPPDTTAGRDVVESIKRGDLDGMSFAFRTVSDNWRTEAEQTIRELRQVELLDVSVVAFPAYPDTSVAMRSLDGIKAERERRTAGEIDVLKKMLDLEQEIV